MRIVKSGSRADPSYETDACNPIVFDAKTKCAKPMGKRVLARLWNEPVIFLRKHEFIRLKNMNGQPLNYMGGSYRKSLGSLNQEHYKAVEGTSVLYGHNRIQSAMSRPGQVVGAATLNSTVNESYFNQGATGEFKMNLTFGLVVDALIMGGGAEMSPCNQIFLPRPFPVVDTQYLIEDAGKKYRLTKADIIGRYGPVRGTVLIAKGEEILGTKFDFIALPSFGQKENESAGAVSVPSDKKPDKKRRGSGVGGLASREDVLGDEYDNGNERSPGVVVHGNNNTINVTININRSP